MPRGSKPGERRGGRPKGGQNKVTVAVKQALLDAFDGLGGVPSLIRWGKANPTPFYQTWARLAPIDVTSNGKTIDGETRAQRLAAILAAIETRATR